uniref:Uncharacterized protein n=1 Tax=Romanomermis culicivorax TaxID=13658 RepID=A0A915JEZ9_ROMCU
MDVQIPQAPSTSAPALDRHGQPIGKLGGYEHSVKCKQHLHERAEPCKSHKTRTTDEPHTRGMPPSSTSRTECGKMPSKRTTHHLEQPNQQKAGETTSQTSSQPSATLQPKVMTTKRAAPSNQPPPVHQSDSHRSHHKSHSHEDCHRKETQQPHTTSCDSCQQNAVLMHHCTAPKGNKRPRCTLPVSSKRRTSTVSTDHH